MSLFASLAALVWEYLAPKAPVLPEREIARGHRWLLDHINAGGVQHGLLAWTLGVLAPALLMAFLGALAAGVLSILGWAFEVAVLYFMFAFRRASYQAASIARALDAEDVSAARNLLQAWNPGLMASDRQDGVVRQTLEETIKLSLTALFGILFWFWVAGIAGALVYWLSHACLEQWRSEGQFARFSRQAVYWLDWLPARALAFSFAIVGNFQDAAECWRSQAASWGEPGRDENEGVMLSAAAGALGIRLGGALHLGEQEVPRSDLGVDELPGSDSIDAAVALVWRAVLLWVSVAGLLWLGGL